MYYFFERTIDFHSKVYNSYFIAYFKKQLFIVYNSKILFIAFFTYFHNVLTVFFLFNCVLSTQ